MNLAAAHAHMLPSSEAVERHRGSALPPASPKYSTPRHAFRAESPRIRRERRRNAAWDVASVSGCTLMLLLGIALISVSGKLSGSTQWHGQAVGFLCCLLGVLGWFAAGLPLPGSHGGLGVFDGDGSDMYNGLTSNTTIRLGRMLGIPIRTALLVGIGLAVLGTISLLDQASNDLGIHCAMAEASVRIVHLEETVMKLKHDELLTQVFFRLNEMDDLLEAAASGTTAHSELRSQTFHLQSQDRDLIRERVNRLHRHADKLLADMQTQLETTNKQLAALENRGMDHQHHHHHHVDKANYTGGGQAGSREAYRETRQRYMQRKAQREQQEAEAEMLGKRIDAVKSVLQYLEERTHDAHAELSFDEYEIILNALLEGSAKAFESSASKRPEGGSVSYHQSPSGEEEVTTATSATAALHKALQKDQADLESARLAFERRTGGTYELNARADPRFQAIRELQNKREASRKEFEARFFNVYKEGAGHFDPDAYRKSLSGALDGLPGHCLQDTSAFGWLRWIAGGLAIAEALTAYTIATSITNRLMSNKDS